MTIDSTASGARNGKRIGRAIVFCVCTLLATFAASLAVGDDGIVTSQPNSLQAILVLGLSIFLFWYLAKTRRSFSPIIGGVAALFSLFTVLGMQLDAGSHTLVLRGIVIGTATTSSSLVGVAIMDVAFMGFALFYYAAIAFAYEKLEGLSLPLGQKKSDEREESTERKGSTIFGRVIDYRLCIVVMLVAWLPYLIYYFPGTVSSDTSRQLAQLFGTNGLALDTHFPFLVGLVFSGLYQLGCLFDPSGYAGMFLMVLVQVALGLLAFSSVVVWLGRIDASRWLVRGALAFFALFPLIPVHMVLVDKDTLHAELVVILALQILLLFRAKRGIIQRSVFFSPLAVGVVALLVALTRNNGIVLVIVALGVTAVLLKSKWVGAALGGVLALCCLWQFALLPSMGVASEGNREMLSMPAQIVAAHLADDLPLTDDERTAAQDSFTCDLDAVADRYDPLIADKVKRVLDVDSPEKLKDFLILTARLTAQNPGHALSAALSTTYGTWYPFCYGTYHGEDVPYINSPGNTWANPEWFASYQDLPDMNARTGLGNKLLHALHYAPGLSLLYTPGVYLWLIVFILGFSLYVKRGRRQTTSVLAMFFALSLVMVFGPCSSLRYTLPFVFTLPVFAMLLVACLSDRPQNAPLT